MMILIGQVIAGEDRESGVGSQRRVLYPREDPNSFPKEADPHECRSIVKMHDAYQTADAAIAGHT